LLILNKEKPLFVIGSASLYLPTELENFKEGKAQKSFLENCQTDVLLAEISMAIFLAAMLF
jgi:hypothetical protein